MAKTLLVILKDGNRQIRIHGVDQVIVDRAIQELVAYGEDGQVKERIAHESRGSDDARLRHCPLGAGLRYLTSVFLIVRRTSIL